MVDAIAIILSDKGCESLISEVAAVQFVMDAFGHLKTIGYSPEAKFLLEKAGVIYDEGIVDLDAFMGIAGQRHWRREAKVRTLA